MAIFSTLEDIKTSLQSGLSDDAMIKLRSEQRDAIDYAKEHFCKKAEEKGIINIRCCQGNASSYGMRKCVLERPFAPCNLCGS